MNRTTPLQVRLAFWLPLLGACAPALKSPVLTPTDVTVLEAQRIRSPSDPDVLTRLGVVYYQSQKYVQARDVLTAAVKLNPGSFSAAVYLGLTQEALGELSPARDAYRLAQALPDLSRSQRTEIENRLTVLDQLVLRASARAAIAQEAVLSQTPPAANTVAILPWTYLGRNEELRPLERGMAHLLVTDLSKISHLKLVERERAQALTDELKLGASARVESSTAARSGHLLGAERVLQGAIRELPNDGTIRLEANVVDTKNAQISARENVSDRLQALFAMEKQLVVRLIDLMHIEVSPAEFRALSERPTSDLQAFLAFSRGLLAEDRGDFLQANRAYLDAMARDPNFVAASRRASNSARISRASATTTATLAQQANPDRNGGSSRSTDRTIALGNALAVVNPSFGGHLSRLTGSRELPLQKGNAQEGFRQDDPTTIGILGTLIIVVPRP